MLDYVLITPAYNEADFIEETIRSVISQTVLPRRWIIVDDGSSDGTDRIARGYSLRHAWIQCLSMSRDGGYSFARKAQSVNAGRDALKDVAFDLIANLDADVSFEPGYFEFLIGKFEQDERLGVAGTPMIEPGHDPVADGIFNEADVFGACQVFRRECFEQVGGYTPIKGGGVDWVAVRTARMLGWRTRSFLEKRFMHHRPMGLRNGGGLTARFRHGEKDYFLGNHPLWQLSRTAYQATRRPYVIGAASLLSGYLWAAVRRTPRPVPRDVRKFHRREQMQRLKSVLTNKFRQGLDARGPQR